MTRSYRRLDVDLIQCTNQKLCAHIQERFPTANLVRVCQELSDLVDSLKAKFGKRSPCYMNISRNVLIP
jgi:hypothetical protein